LSPEWIRCHGFVLWLAASGVRPRGGVEGNASVVVGCGRAGMPGLRKGGCSVAKKKVAKKKVAKKKK
jgi:hypothetical protein